MESLFVVGIWRNIFVTLFITCDGVLKIFLDIFFFFVFFFGEIFGRSLYFINIKYNIRVSYVVSVRLEFLLILIWIDLDFWRYEGFMRIFYLSSRGYGLG